jgi:hypothetical protein
MTTEISVLSKKRFVVRVVEVEQVFTQGDEFAGGYTKTVSLSDGTAHTVELTPVIREGFQLWNSKACRRVSSTHDRGLYFSA